MMAKLIHVPDQHRCHTELDVFTETAPIGSVAECSCGAQWRLVEAQFDGRHWARLSEQDQLQG